MHSNGKDLNINKSTFFVFSVSTIYVCWVLFFKFPNLLMNKNYLGLMKKILFKFDWNFKKNYKTVDVYYKKKTKIYILMNYKILNVYIRTKIYLLKNYIIYRDFNLTPKCSYFTSINKKVIQRQNAIQLVTTLHFFYMYIISYRSFFHFYPFFIYKR